MASQDNRAAPLSSQMRAKAQEEASLQRGFNATHEGILTDADALRFLTEDIHQVQTKYPPEHMHWFFQGGLSVPCPSAIGPIATSPRKPRLNERGSGSGQEVKQSVRPPELPEEWGHIIRDDSVQAECSRWVSVGRTW